MRSNSNCWQGSPPTFHSQVFSSWCGRTQHLPPVTDDAANQRLTLLISEEDCYNECGKLEAYKIRNNMFRKKMWKHFGHFCFPVIHRTFLFSDFFCSFFFPSFHFYLRFEPDLKRNNQTWRSVGCCCRPTRHAPPDIAASKPPTCLLLSSYLVAFILMQIIQTKNLFGCKIPNFPQLYLRLKMNPGTGLFILIYPILIFWFSQKYISSTFPPSKIHSSSLCPNCIPQTTSAIAWRWPRIAKPPNHLRSLRSTVERGWSPTALNP